MANNPGEHLPGDLSNNPGEFPFDLLDLPGELLDNPGDKTGEIFSKCDVCQKNFLNINNLKMCVPCLVEENERLKTVVDNLMARETCKNCDRIDNWF